MISHYMINASNAVRRSLVPIGLASLYCLTNIVSAASTPPSIIDTQQQKQLPSRATLSAIERGTIAEHIQSCWGSAPRPSGASDPTVHLIISTDAEGIARQVEITPGDPALALNTPSHDFAVRAAKIVLEPHCSPLPLPLRMFGIPQRFDLIFSIAAERSPGQKRSYSLADFPVSTVYDGPPRMPDFRNRDHKFASYRTRILEGLKQGSNFSGHYALIEVGCGTDCRFAYVADVASGQVFDFPLGGEQNYQLSLSYSLNSSLVIAHWIQDGRCILEDFIWKESHFVSIRKVDVGDSGFCNQIP